jgi:predicted ATPase
LLVPQTIASTLGIRDEPGRPVVNALVEYFRSRHALILLDNCEHLIDACAQLADTLLRSCAHIRVLATSRELLGVGGEATWRVRSLSLVDPGSVAATDSIGALLASEAGRLFIDRARLTVPSFAITAHNVAAVAQVCQRLDGIPLAIELAAARLSMLSVAQIAARLDQRFWLLAGGSRTAVRRQQTLQAAIDWSYDLLSDEERTLFRRLAVFAGGWSLEAAEALDADAARPHEHVPDLLGRLVAKSMVQVEEPHANEPSVPRYRFLETVRQYAEDKLLESGEAEGVRMRHRDWYLSLAAQAMDGMEGADQKRWWDRLELEHDNFRAALSWSAVNQRGSEQLLLLAGMLSWFWQTRWYIREGIGWLEMALAQTEATPSAARARALAWLGQLEGDRSGYAERAWRLLEESIAQARVVGDQCVLSLALRHLGTAAFSCGDHTRARRLIEEALAVSREAGRQRESAWNLFMLGAMLADAGQRDAGEPLLLESVALGKESGDLTPVIPSLWALSRLYGMRGDLALARRTVAESMALARQLDMKYPIQALLVTLGDLASAEQDWASAADWYREGLRAASLMAAGGAMAHALRHYATIRGARGAHRGVVRIFGATSTVHGTSFARILDVSSAGEDDLLAAARCALSENEFALAWAEGQAITLDQAIVEILSEENEGTPTARRVLPQRADCVSAKERKVLTDRKVGQFAPEPGRP